MCSSIGQIKPPETQIPFNTAVQRLIESGADPELLHEGGGYICQIGDATINFSYVDLGQSASGLPAATVPVQAQHRKAVQLSSPDTELFP